MRRLDGSGENEMKTASMVLASAAVLVGSLGQTPWAAAGTDDAKAAVLACRKEQDAERRLACFDAASARLEPGAAHAQAASAAVPAAAVTNAAAAPAGAAKSSHESFGVRGGTLAKEAEKNSEPKLENLTANVTAMEKGPHGELVFTLDNGQVWMQKQAVGYFPVRVGDAVSVKARALGSFQLVTSSGKATHVTRVK